MGEEKRPQLRDVERLLKPGMVMVTLRKGWLGWLIKRVTNAQWSHAVLIDRRPDGKWVTVEAADFNGVSSLPLASYFKSEKVVAMLIRDAVPRPGITMMFRESLSGEERDRILEAAWEKVGSAYDTRQLVGIYMRRLPQRLGLGWLMSDKPLLGKNKLDSEGKYICSELVTICYWEGARYDLTPMGVAVGMVDPGHLARTPHLRNVWEWHAAPDLLGRHTLVQEPEEIQGP